MTDPVKPADELPVPMEPTPADAPAESIRVAPPPAPVTAAYAATPSRLPLVVAGIALVAAVAALIWASQSGDAASGQVAALQTRIAALEQRPAPPSLQPLDTRVAALEKRPVVDPAAIDQRLTALDNKPPPQAVLDAAGHTEIAALAGRVDQITARQSQLGTQEQADIAKLADQLKAQDTKLNDQLAAENAKLADQLKAQDTKLADQLASEDAKLADQLKAQDAKLGDQLAAETSKMDAQLAAQRTQIAGQLSAQESKLATASTAAGQATAASAKAGQQVDALTTQQTRTAQLGAAAVALEGGRPLGPITGAPPALAKFATAPPPTEASLRLGFNDAAEAAQVASRPAPSDAPLWNRMLARAQNTVTVKQGDRVVLGSPISSYIEAARIRLTAGDIAGALGALDNLDGPAAEAMAPWRQQAQSLLDARAALLTAAHG